ncbi:MAG: dockerin type I domain-containing protein [Euryarchaeota archaeon]|nr:dockerin type I domain-containing protein [Euryarchaeota archaeon]
MYNTKQHICIIVIIVSASISCCCAPVSAWSNGGYSDDPGDVCYGTHDWIAEHALNFLPPAERQYIDDNLNWYLYGTELPDNPHPDDGICDTSKHHVYFYENGSLMDDASAVRAQDIYNNTLAFLKEGDCVNASKYAGIMTHYIADVAVFGHVMGKKTDWSAEVHHGDYESYVQRRTDGNVSEAFDPYIEFDGTLDVVTAYDATIHVANDTTFDAESEGRGCIWMDSHYNWSDPGFRDECGESLNLAINVVADVLHTLYSEACSEQRGDLNGDGMITSADAMIVLRMTASGEYSNDADMNRDGSVTSLDALMILQDAEAGDMD